MARAVALAADLGGPGADKLVWAHRSGNVAQAMVATRTTGGTRQVGLIAPLRGRHRLSVLSAFAVARFTADAMRGDKACLQCHASTNYATPSHTHHGADSPGARCQNCHTPHVSYTLLKATRTHMVTSPSARITAQTGRPDACSACHLDKPLSWTANKLSEWYGQPPAQLSDAQRSIATGMLLGLSGDALQRALVAWHLGWPPAQAASGTDWMPAVLLQGLADPNPAVRYVAARSLKTLPGYEALAFDFVGDDQARTVQDARLLRVWSASRWRADTHGGKSLQRPKPITLKQYGELIRGRDDAPVALPE